MADWLILWILNSWKDDRLNYIRCELPRSNSVLRMGRIKEYAEGTIYRLERSASVDGRELWIEIYQIPRINPTSRRSPYRLHITRTSDIRCLQHDEKGR